MTTNKLVERHTITALVQDKPGVLNRVTSMFRRRGFNISSLAVGHSEIAHLSRMTFVVEGGDQIPNDSFESVSQVTEAMNDPRYDKDPAYRKKVTDKIARSSVI